MRHNMDKTSYLRLENSIICERQTMLFHQVQSITCKNNAHTPIHSIVVSHSRPQTDQFTTCLAVEYCCLEVHVAEEPSERVSGNTDSGYSTIPRPVPCSRMLPCTADPRNTEWPIALAMLDQDTSRRAAEQWVASGVNGQQSRLMPNRQQNDQQRKHLGV